MTTNCALFLEWASPIEGREIKSLEEFMSHVAWWGELKKTGKIADFNVFLPTTGPLGDRAGLAILSGTEKQMIELHTSEEFRTRVARASVFVRNVRVNLFETGDAIQARMQRYAKAVKETVG